MVWHRMVHCCARMAFVCGFLLLFVTMCHRGKLVREAVSLIRVIWGLDSDGKYILT